MFKVKPDGRIERRLHKNSLVKDKKVFAHYQPKEQNNMTIMKSGSTVYEGSTPILYWKGTGC